MNALYVAVLSVALAVGNAVQTPMKTQHVPGAGIAVADGTTPVLDAGYGVADLSTNTAVSPDTRFEIGSITKSFTAAAILQLKEQGKLKLTDTLGKFIPEYGPGKNVTLEQMLWNVSGIPDFLFVKGYPAFWKIASKSSGSFDEALAFIKDAPLGFEPGTQYEYSNSNWLLLGEVIDRVSHMPWQEYVRKNLFARAGMTQSAFIEDEPTLSTMATGYRLSGKTGLAPSPWVGHWFDGAGAIVSTARDVTKWDEAFFGGKIVDLQDVALATSAHVLPSGQSTGEGFGWWSDTFGGQPRYMFTGRTWGFTAENQYFPKLHEAIVVLTNDANEQVWAVANATLGALRPRIMQAYLTPAVGEDPKITALVEQWVHRLDTGNIDRSQLNAKLPDEELSEDEQAIQNRGQLTAAVYRHKAAGNGGTAYLYVLQFQGGVMTLAVTIDPAGKIADMSLLQGEGHT